MSGTDIAQKVTAGLIKAGEATGNDGGPNSFIIKRMKADYSTTPPTEGKDVPFPCKVLLTSYSARDRANSEIAITDLKAMIAPDAGAIPETGDRLEVDGTPYALSNVVVTKPGGVVLFWTATASAS